MSQPRRRRDPSPLNIYVAAAAAPPPALIYARPLVPLADVREELLQAVAQVHEVRGGDHVERSEQRDPFVAEELVLRLREVDPAGIRDEALHALACADETVDRCWSEGDGEGVGDGSYQRHGSSDAPRPRPRRGCSAETSRGDAAAATWMFRGDESRPRRRRGEDAGRPSAGTTKPNKNRDRPGDVPRVTSPGRRNQTEILKAWQSQDRRASVPILRRRGLP